MMSAIALHARPDPDFASRLQATRDALCKLVQDHPRSASGGVAPVVQASSLGAEDMVVSHLIDALGLDVEIFVLQTGMLHAQTLALLERLRTTARIPVTVYEPRAEAVLQFVQREGPDAMRRSIELRKTCCAIRKMEPLARALEGRSAWITGLRREQSDARAQVPLLDDSDPARVKLNPLADWSWGDVWHYIAQHQVAYNPLHDQFYPSIGCAPCTRAISLGEDLRAGRWWWEQDGHKECGLHVSRRAVPKANSAAACQGDGQVPARNDQPEEIHP